MKKSKIRFIGLFLVFVFTFAISASAITMPYSSYTYWSDVGNQDKAVQNREFFKADSLITTEKIGITDFTQINDICTDQKGNIYVLDDASRIVVLSENGSLLHEIGCIGDIRYDEAQGIYTHSDETIYICDTKGHRIIHITNSGELINVIELPDSIIIPEDFNFAPTSVAIDKYGYLYVVSDGSYYGALLYSPDYEFLGFYGANAVKGSLTSVITNIKNRLFPNNEKMANMSKNLPFCFVDISISKDGFIYTCNGYTSKSDSEGQIRCLSPGTGDNILESDDVNFVDFETNESYKDGILSKQDIMDVEVDENGFIFGLESAYGKVFLYDKSGKTLSVFGGGAHEGTQVGTFKNVSGMALSNDGNKVYVSDKTTNYITVFKITDFGELVKKATALTVKGKYEQAKELWSQVIKMDNNYQPAYSGLARVCLIEENYEEAMRLSKIGYDRDTYAIAFENERKEILNENFGLIFVLIAVAIIALLVFIVISSKKKIVLIKNEEFKFMTSVLIHPVNVFTDLKEKKKGSLVLSVGCVAVFYVVSILQTLAGGFLFTYYDAEEFNSFWVLIQTVGLVLLWIVSNWMVSTLLGGIGKLKEITMVTCYSLLPLIIEKAIRIVLTNFLLPTEAEFLSILDIIAVIYFVILMVIGLLRVHDFSLTKLICTTVLSFLGIAIIIFLIIMITILVQQFWGFIATIFTELSTLLGG